MEAMTFQKGQRVRVWNDENPEPRAGRIEIVSENQRSLGIVFDEGTVGIYAAGSLAITPFLPLLRLSAEDVISDLWGKTWHVEPLPPPNA